MESLFIEATKYTPKIDFNVDTKIFEISGKSFPENTFEFFEPIYNCLKSYFNDSSNKKITFNFDLIYYNSSSSKSIFDIFDILEEAKEKVNIIINWRYDEENEAALEAGEDFKEDFADLSINLIQKSG